MSMGVVHVRYAQTPIACHCGMDDRIACPVGGFQGADLHCKPSGATSTHTIDQAVLGTVGVLLSMARRYLDRLRPIRPEGTALTIIDYIPPCYVLIRREGEGEGHPRSRLQRAALIGRALGNLELGTYLIRGT